MIKRLLILLLLHTCLLIRGQVWSNVIDSMPMNGNTWFRNTLVDTISNTLYISGSFEQINEKNTRCIIKYDGTNFDTLYRAIDPQWRGINTPTDIRAMVMFQNKLYAGGQFQKAGDYYTRHLARWNGTTWDTVNFRPDQPIESMIVHNNELYVAGGFDTIGGVVSHKIAKYDGINWHSLNMPDFDAAVVDIEFFQDTLYACGNFYEFGFSLLAKYNGTTWVPWRGVQGSIYKGVFGLKTIDTMLYVYGRFDNIASTNCKGLAAFNGKKWYGYGIGMSTQGGWEAIQNIEKINGDLYVTGMLDKIENIGTSNFSISQSTNLAKFDGQKWCAISPPFANEVNGVVWYKNNLYCHGSFRKIGNDSVFGLVKWIGAASTVTCSQNVSIYQSAESVNEISITYSIKIYPNPATTVLNIYDEQNDLRNTTITITNALGETILSIDYSSQIDISNLPPGIYFLNLHTKASQKTVKFLKTD